jgi:hypothetical protein
MPVSTAIPPVASKTAFSNGLPAFLSGGVPSTVVSEKYVGGAPKIPTAADVGMIASGQVLSPPNIPAVIESFVLSLENAANNTGLLSPARAGWTFFAGGTNDKTVLGRVVHRKHVWKLVAVYYGELVFQKLEASQHLDSLLPAQFQQASYESRLLAIPGLNLEVFWLSATKPGGVDLVVRTPTAPTKVGPPLFFPPGKALELQSFLAQIRPLASALLSMPAGYGA